MVTVQQLEEINKAFPNKDAYKTMGGGNLSLPQFCSANRLVMADQFFQHMIPLINPESPLIPTGFEKSYGKYTDSYKVADSDYLVIAMIPKFMLTGRFKYIYVVQNTLTKVYDVIDISHYECLSEDQGYLRPFTKGDEYNPGDVIRKGSTLYRSNNHDEYGNYAYGLNPNVCYISLPENEEDGMVISQSFYERAAFYNFKKTQITLNRNQVLLNLYGTDSVYKGFPDIGEAVKDGILYAKRSINYDNAAAELTDNALKHIVSNDEICRGEGYVADIDVFINDREEFEDSGNKSQIYKYYTALVEYYRKVFAILDPIVNAPQRNRVQYTHNLRVTFEHARNYLNEQLQWTNNNNSFEFAYIVITTYEKKNIFNGFKITNRYGGKGVVSKIWPDEFMPVDEFGNRADIILSPPGVPARSNPGQWYEHEYSFIAGEIVKRIKKLPTLQQKCKVLVEFISDANPKEGAALSKFLSSKTEPQLIEFFDDMYVHGIYLTEEPFGGTISIANLEFLYNNYKIRPGKITMKREFKDAFTALPIENVAARQVTGKIGDNDSTFTFASEYGVTPFDKVKGEKYAKPTGGVVSVVNSSGEIEYQCVAPDMINAIKTGTINNYNNNYRVTAEINSEGRLVRTYKSLNNVIIGKMYYIVLKQNPDDKFSARSLGSTNQVGIPNKPSKLGNSMAPYSKSAIRNGEMENDNLFVRIDNEMVHRYMSTHSTNPVMIEALAKMLLTEDPMELHDIDIANEDICDDVPAIMLHATLYSGCGLEIKPIYANK